MGKLVSYSWSPKQKREDRPLAPVKPNPSVSRKYLRAIDGHELKQDSYGKFYILKPSEASPSSIRIEIPYDHAIWVMGLDDALLTDDLKVLKK